jgi:hypothetical protein
VSYGRPLGSAVFLYAGICANGVRIRRLRLLRLRRFRVEPIERPREPHRRTLEVGTRRRDVRVTEKVAHVVQVGIRFEQATGKLPPQIVEVQVRDAGRSTDVLPRLPNRLDFLADGVPEDVRGTGLLGPVRRIASEREL